MRRSSRGWLAVIAVVGVVVGVASAVGAQVDPGAAGPRVVWAASCMSPGPGELVVYGRGWAAGSVDLAVADQTGTSVGGGLAEAPGGRFQARLGLSVPAAASSLRVTAMQAGVDKEHSVAVAATCSPTVAAVATGPSCAVVGQAIVLDVTVQGVPVATFDRVVHTADLYGPAESVSRLQPPRAEGTYAVSLTVANVPGRVVPVTVEARQLRGGAFTYATTTIGLPPLCVAPPTAATTATTRVLAPTATTTTVPATPSPGILTTLPPFPTLVPGPRPTPGVRTLSLSPSLGQAGQTTTVSGAGFGPSATLTLRWRPGIGSWTVRAGGDGSFRTQVLVLPNDIEGPRVLEVVEAAMASPYLVVPGSEQPAFGGVFVRS